MKNGKKNKILFQKIIKEKIIIIKLKEIEKIKKIFQIKKKKKKNKTSSVINDNEDKKTQIQEIFRPTLKERLKNKKEKDFNLSNIKKKKIPIDEFIDNIEFMDSKTR